MGGDPGTRFDLKMPHPEGFGTVAGIHQDCPGDTWITLFRLGVGSVQDRHQFTSFFPLPVYGTSVSAKVYARMPNPSNKDWMNGFTLG